MRAGVFVTMQDLGVLYGMNRKRMGLVLKDIRLREKDGEPTRRAHAGGFVSKRGVHGREQYSVWTWDLMKTLAALKEAGFKTKDEMDQEKGECPHETNPKCRAAHELRQSRGASKPTVG